MLTIAHSHHAKNLNAETRACLPKTQKNRGKETTRWADPKANSQYQPDSTFYIYFPIHQIQW